MHKHEIYRLNRKLNLLLNTIETLNIYEYEEPILRQVEQITKKHSFTKCRKIIVSNLETHKDIISVIYRIYKIITQKYIQEIITNILHNYAGKHKSATTLQYIKRYMYIHKKNQSYYNMNSHYSNLSLEEVAITTLYVINRMNQKKGLLLLINYLYE